MANYPVWITKAWKGCGLFLITVLLLILVIVISVRCVTYFSNRITGDNGIDEGIFVSIGGQEQYLLIRGEDIANPVLLWLHGGPASPEGYANYAFQKYLVQDYTVVNWDQRGCGRTYYRNRGADPNNETATFSQAVQDLDGLVDYLCERFHKDSVILVGHSYGSMLGSRYALAHPEKVCAYIGVGQMVTMESDLYSYGDALQIAKDRQEDTTEMERAYEAFLQERSLQNMLALRKYTGPYHKAEKSGNTIWTGIASPYMNLQDLRWFLKPILNTDAFITLNRALMNCIMDTDVRDFGQTFRMPVGFISGSCDWTTPVKYARDYADWIQSPQTQFYVMDGCGHAPQYDDPVEFTTALKDMLEQYLA